MTQLRLDYRKFEKSQVRIILIGPEDVNAFDKYWHLHKLPFTGIPDPRGVVLKLYGQEINLFKLGRMPAQVIVDKKGIARYIHYGKNMADIPANEELFMVFDELNIEK